MFLSEDVRIAYSDTIQYASIHNYVTMQAMIALDQVPGWWQVEEGTAEQYPMDYYAKDGGSWNSVWQTKPVLKKGPQRHAQLTNAKQDVVPSDKA